MWRGGERQASLFTAYAVLTVGHQCLLLFWTAEARGCVRMDHDAAALHLKGLAVSMAVLFLDVPPKLPTSPLLQNLRLNLAKQKDGQISWETAILELFTC